MVKNRSCHGSDGLVASLSPQSLVFALESVLVGFVVDRDALGMVSLRALQFYPVISFGSSDSNSKTFREDEDGNGMDGLLPLCSKFD
jgi:hypothetical protein